ncbi:lipopolysaccharide/colanic/teichoic acid biosynthesis glycosyltransferase [Dietzia kunjamensis]|uniref:sugar transferase n=1 Tax=Dietzia kunjamensis TaxID=322509 RepID=UPI000E750B1A|nr:sugar transferase [Dietzia kunjamensis]MBB1012577.1 sugar transferase [Dietzia kunjamensis]RKE59499.1 lipopolysaccharide/colanic/teichoic acid biosynthesis glycosyltransferase [Dietzia kunjamensis]
MPYRGKRLLDLVVSVPILLLSLPVQAAAALAIRVKMGSPVLFSQTRPGLNGQPFEMRKFRTMHPIDPSRGWTDDNSRLTRLGAFLRSTSIDELPTVWNIIRGDMSLVGPRPLLMSYLGRYSSLQARRMEVLPGLTGLAQVNGRNAQTWDERFAWDVEYVDSASLRIDLEILLKTVLTVARRSGITADGEATMPEFKGTVT